MHLFWIFAALGAPTEEGEEVVVQAPAGPDPAQTSGSVTVLELGPDLPPGQDLGRVLEQASGTRVRRLGGLGSFTAISLRGSSFRQVEIFLDGLPLNPDGASTVDLSELSASSFSRVELWRGNAPIDFGSAAMGGVVNLVSFEKPPPPSLRISGGSYLTGHAEALAGARIGPVDGLVAADGLYTAGNWQWFDNRGTEFNLADDRTRQREHNGSSRLSTLGRLRWLGPNFTTTLLNSYTRSFQDLPGDAANPASSATFASDRNLLALRHDHRLGLWRLQQDIWWAWRLDRLKDPQDEIGFWGSTEDKSHSAGGLFLLKGLLRPWLLGAASFRIRTDHYTPEEHFWPVGEERRDRLAGGLAMSTDLRLFKDRLGISPVIQGEWLNARMYGELPSGRPENQLWAFTPRLGVLVRPLDRLSLKGNLGRYLRPPDFSELFGNRGTVTGNLSLLPEQGTAWDLGFHAELSDEMAWLYVDGAWAENWAKNLIVYVQNSQETQQARNIGRAWIRSLELSLHAGFSSWFQSQSNLTWMQSRNLVSDPTYANRELPGLPNLEFSESLTLSWEEKLRFTWNYSWTDASWQDSANYQRNAPRPLHGFSLQSQPARRWPTFEVEVLNLFDVHGMAVPRDPLGADLSAKIVKPLTDYSGFPLPGRTILVGVQWSPEPRSDR